MSDVTVADLRPVDLFADIDDAQLAEWAAVARWREANPQLYQVVYAAVLEANDFIAKNPREAAEIFVKVENTRMPVPFIEKMISDPEFSAASTTTTPKLNPLITRLR